MQVDKTSYSVDRFSTTSCARKLNSSVLFSSTRRNSCQFPGMELAAATRRLTPFPRFSLAVDFRLSGM